MWHNMMIFKVWNNVNVNKPILFIYIYKSCNFLWRYSDDVIMSSVWNEAIETGWVRNVEVDDLFQNKKQFRQWNSSLLEFIQHRNSLDGIRLTEQKKKNLSNKEHFYL